MKINPNIPFSYLKLYLTARSDIFLPPFPGSAFRGAFGASLRKACCTIDDQECAVCMLKPSCIYAMVFETDHSHVQKEGYHLSDFPRPFIIEPEFPCQEHLKPGDMFTCNFLLMGMSIVYLPYFVNAFINIGRLGLGKERGLYHVNQITDLLADQELQIFDGKSYTFIKPPQQWQLNTLPICHHSKEKITLIFDSPTRIKYQNRLTKELSFELFMKNLLRRMGLLAQLCNDTTWNPDFKSILDQAKHVTLQQSNLYWYDWKRYSFRQQNHMKLGGFMGDITFCGPLQQFIPFIAAGHYIHIGKACTFGLGKYQMI